MSLSNECVCMMDVSKMNMLGVMNLFCMMSVFIQWMCLYSERVLYNECAFKSVKPAGALVCF